MRESERVSVCMYVCMHMYFQETGKVSYGGEWLRLVASFKLYVSFAEELYKKDYILQKIPTILRSLLIEAIPHVGNDRMGCVYIYMYVYVYI